MTRVIKLAEGCEFDPAAVPVLAARFGTGGCQAAFPSGVEAFYIGEGSDAATQADGTVVDERSCKADEVCFQLQGLQRRMDDYAGRMSDLVIAICACPVLGCSAGSAIDGAFKVDEERQLEEAGQQLEAATATPGEAAQQLDQQQEEKKTAVQLDEADKPLNDAKVMPGEADQQLDETSVLQNDAGWQLDDAKVMPSEADQQLDDTSERQNDADLQLDDAKVRPGEADQQLDDMSERQNDADLQLDDAKVRPGEADQQLDDTSERQNDADLQLDDAKARQNDGILYQQLLAAVHGCEGKGPMTQTERVRFGHAALERRSDLLKERLECRGSIDRVVEVPVFEDLLDAYGDWLQNESRLDELLHAMGERPEASQKDKTMCASVAKCSSKVGKQPKMLLALLDDIQALHPWSKRLASRLAELDESWQRAASWKTFVKILY